MTTGVLDASGVGAAPRPEATVASVGRGGAVNLIGAVVYGAANFALLVVLTHEYGLRPAGVILVAIGLFNICLNFAQLGCSTGFIRQMARHRALGRQDLMAATLWVGIVPVLAIGSVLGGAMWLLAPVLARLFSHGTQADQVTDIVRAMAPFLPLSAVYNVVVQGTRGFDTMLPQTVIEKTARAASLPVIAYLGARAGVGTTGFGALWAASNVVALVPAWVVFRRQIARSAAAAGAAATPADLALFRRFWSFTAPRAVGQVSEVVVNWLDTVLIGALVSTRAAGIYGSGTRYLLPGQFTSDALMQVTGPRISGLLSLDRRDDAQDLLQVTTGWQTMIVWPLYLLVALYARPLLQIFGAQVVEAQVAVVALAASLLVVSLLGPVQAVILMSGRSRQAMFNTFLLVAINVVGNVVLVPRYGLNAAGVVWGVTIVLASAVPAWQSLRLLGITTTGRASWRVAGRAAATVGVVGGVVRIILGPTLPALLTSVIAGGLPYTWTVRRMRDELHLPELLQGFSHRAARPERQRHVVRDDSSRRNMNEFEGGFDLADLYGTLRRRWRIIAAAGVTGALIGLIVCAAHTTSYDASATIVVQPIATTLSVDNAASRGAAAPTSLGDLVASDSVARAVGKRLHLADSAADILTHVETVDSPGSLTVVITFTDTDPKLAQEGATEFGRTFLELRKAKADNVLATARAKLDATIAPLTNQLSAANSYLASTDPQAGSSLAAKAQVESLTSQLEGYNAQKTALTTVDTTPGQLTQAASLPTSGAGVPAIVLLVGVTALVALIGFGLALLRDRRDPRVAARADVARLSPTSAVEPLPSAVGPGGAARRAVAFSRVTLHLTPTGPTVAATSVLLAGVDDTLPTGAVVELHRALREAGRTTLLVSTVPITAAEAPVGVALRSLDPILRRSTSSLRRLVAREAGAVVVVPGDPGIEPGTEPDPSAAATLDPDAMDKLLTKAAAEEFDVVVFVALSPASSSRAVVAARRVDTVVVAAAPTATRGQVRAAVSVLIEIGRPPCDVLVG